MSGKTLLSQPRLNGGASRQTSTGVWLQAMPSASAAIDIAINNFVEHINRLREEADSDLYDEYVAGW